MGHMAATANVWGARAYEDPSPTQPDGGHHPVLLRYNLGESSIMIPDAHRIDDLSRLYAILDRLEKAIGGTRVLSNCTGRDRWPPRGVYFFREIGEYRTETGKGPRIVRVGTHALITGATTTLWGRLSQHKGHTKSGGGNHRGSIFRLLVGTALIRKNGYTYPTWGKGSSASSAIRAAEAPLEREVSQVIGNMPFVWLAVDDAPGPGSLRGYIERNAIALLSNHGKKAIDPASPHWLGRHCSRGLVASAGIWNTRHVEDTYDRAFLDELERRVKALESPT